MAQLVYGMPGDERLSWTDERVRVFGVRHLSPAGAYHLRAFLDDFQPDTVLVEGPSDASGLIGQLTGRGVVPPVALLAYTDRLPVRTLLFPLAAYSPEYQAFVWAAKRGARAAFMDLPSGASLALRQREEAEALEKGGEGARPGERRSAFYREQRSVYERIAALADEPDYESYWERHFEHNVSEGAYLRSILAYSAQMRELSEQEERNAVPHETAYNAIREAYMRRRITETLASGKAKRVAVVTGAYHASALHPALPPMTDDELAALPAEPTKLTLMPYSYYKLSSQSGYGAGNPAPAYFELLWQCLGQEQLAALPSRYLSAVASELRRSGAHRSTASIIEGVRLAEALASLREGSLPTLKDLRDAATVVFGFGELAPIAEALARIDIGTAIGALPEGVSQTPIQDDLSRQLKRLKLESYKSTVAAELELDLRENRRVKTEEAAFLDLRRSTFLHRLQLLRISFARKQRTAQDGATWAERWVLQWTPEAEIETVESTLKGETIEWACAYELKERLAQCASLPEASALIRAACECELPELMEQGRRTLQRLGAESGQLADIAAAARELSVLIRYKDVRRADTGPLEPLLRQLFLRGALLLVDAAACSDDAAGELLEAMSELHRLSQEHHELVDDELWLTRLRELAQRDDRNARLSGCAFAILLERGAVTDAQCEREVARRLSPGIPAELGAGWFEGLSLRNRYALLSRAELWRQLDAYIQSLDNPQFQRSLVFLRRAFGAFEAREKQSIAELLGEFWGMNGEEAAERLNEPLNDEERGKLDELNDFDFGDL